MPNQNPTPVGLREILESEDWVSAKAELPIALGKDVSGFKSIQLPYLRVANVQDGYLDLTDVKTVRAQTLVVAGSRDELAGSTEELAALIPGARAVTLPGCDHFSTIAHALFKAAVFDFLEETEI